MDLPSDGLVSDEAKDDYGELSMTIGLLCMIVTASHGASNPNWRVCVASQCLVDTWIQARASQRSYHRDAAPKLSSWLSHFPAVVEPTAAGQTNGAVQFDPSVVLCRKHTTMPRTSNYCKQSQLFRHAGRTWTNRVWLQCFHYSYSTDCTLGRKH